jgi:anti-sigma regulatory factor (Ser/Thr protein kinase)
MATCLHVTLALDELFTNVISYGYDGGAKGDRDIVVELGVKDGELTVALEDDGRAFDPTSMPPPDIDADLEDRAIGGLGIHFVRNFMDSVDYNRTNGYNRLMMRKSLNNQQDPA